MIYRLFLLTLITLTNLTNAADESQLEKTASVNFDFSFLPDKVSELDGEILSSSQFLKLMEHRLAKLNLRLVSADELKIFSVKFIEEYYERKVKLLLAKESGLSVNMGIAELELSSLEKRLGKPALRKQFEFTGAALSDKVRYYAETKLINEYFEKKVLQKNLANEAEALEFYFDNESQFYREERVKIAQIYISLIKPEDKEASQEKIKQAMKKLTAGEKFSDVAEEFSALGKNDSTIKQYFTKNELRPELRSAFNLSIGSFSKVIESNHGFHIIKILERKPAGQQSFDDVKDSLIRQLSLKRSQKALHQQIVDRMKQGGFKLYIKP